MFAKVLLPLPFDKPFDYALAEGQNYQLGEIVLVPFGSKQVYGVIWGISDKTDVKDSKKIKKIIASAAENGFEILPISKPLGDLLEWQAGYCITELGKVLSLVYSGKFFKTVKAKKVTGERLQVTDTKEITLTNEQQVAYENIKERLNEFSVTLLEGVTGSGKTEVYFELIAQMLAQGKQSLIMLPEILLTSQLIKRFEKRFGFRPVIWHSIVSEAKRRKAFFDIANGKVSVVIGARSSLHLPYKNLGLIIVDEEHDGSFKQEEQIIYNARDIAVVRGKCENIPVILATATPSIETYHNVESKRYFHEKLASRFNEAQMPDVELVDMRVNIQNNNEFISYKIREEIENNLKQGQQSLLFLNRRGYAPLTLCGKCGFRFKSPDTSAWMVMHIDNHGEQYLKCHHSGHTIKMPKKCPKCEAENSFRICGPGVQRVTEEVKRLFPNARIAEMASDTTTSQSNMDELITKIEQKEIDIIIGTQIIAKGHHFPALKLVGIIDGDLGLDFENLRSGEKTFQLLHQVSGRAGREQLKGKVMIQTFEPSNKVMQALLKGDMAGFMKYELQERKEADLPPFSRLCAVTVSSASNSVSEKAAKEFIKYFSQNNRAKLFGPAPALYHEYRGNFRYRILIKADRRFDIQSYFRSALAKFKYDTKNIKIRVDVDPINFA